MVVMESCFALFWSSKSHAAQRSAFNVRSTLIDCYSSQTWRVVHEKPQKKTRRTLGFYLNQTLPPHSGCRCTDISCGSPSPSFPFGAGGGQGAWLGQSDLSPDQTLTWAPQAIVASSVTIICSDERRSGGERSNDERFFACSLTPC